MDAMGFQPTFPNSFHAMSVGSEFHARDTAGLPTTDRRQLLSPLAGRSNCRRSRQRLLIDPTHYDGPNTERVLAPTPLGRMGRKLQELWALAPQRRPIDLYAALAEVAR